MQIPHLARSLRRASGIVAVAALLALVGCANGEFRPTDPFDRGVTFSEAQHRYTVLIRWSEFQKAKSFVAEADRDSFLSKMKGLKDARFTDYESEDVELDEEKRTATVRVTYTAYVPSSPYELEIVEVQEWSRDGVGNDWRVHSTFEGVPSVAAN